MACGIIFTAQFDIRSGRKQYVAVEGATVHADTGDSGSVTVPLREFVESPSDMRNRISLGIAEFSHVVSQQAGLEATFDINYVALADSKIDRLAHIGFEWVHDIAAIHHDASVHRAVVSAGRQKAAGPVIPSARR